MAEIPVCNAKHYGCAFVYCNKPSGHAGEHQHIDTTGVTWWRTFQVE